MRVLIVGLGSIAKKHIDALRRIEAGVKIFALRSSSSASVVKDIENVFDTNIIPNLELDFILISNPTGEHATTIRKVLPFNIPLFIEKPLFSGVTDEAEELVREVIEIGIPTYVACNLRFLDCLNEIKTTIDRKRINEVNVYCGSYLPDWRKGVDFRTVYSANKEMGGGVHIDLIHELDYTFWLFGEPKSTKSTFSNSSSLEISACDYSNYLWQYDRFSANIILNYYRRDSKRTLEIVTSEETFLIDLLKNTISKNDEVIFKSSQTVLDTYYKQLTYFIENILLKKKAFNTIEEAYNILKLCIKD